MQASEDEVLSHHFKYTYDDLGRLVKIENLISNYQIKYEYLDFGIRISRKNLADSSTEFVSIFRNDHQTIYNLKDRQIIVLPDSLSDQLVWLIAIRDVQYYGCETNIYEFAYER